MSDAPQPAQISDSTASQAGDATMSNVVQGSFAEQIESYTPPAAGADDSDLAFLDVPPLFGTQIGGTHDPEEPDLTATVKGENPLEDWLQQQRRDRFYENFKDHLQDRLEQQRSSARMQEIVDAIKCGRMDKETAEERLKDLLKCGDWEIYKEEIDVDVTVDEDGNVKVGIDSDGDGDDDVTVTVDGDADADVDVVIEEDKPPKCPPFPPHPPIPHKPSIYDRIKDRQY